MVVMYGGLEIERTYITAKGNSKTEITCIYIYIYISLFIYLFISVSLSKISELFL